MSIINIFATILVLLRMNLHPNYSEFTHFGYSQPACTSKRMRVNTHVYAHAWVTGYLGNSEGGVVHHVVAAVIVSRGDGCR